jgi:hypothetical protein
VGLSPSGAAAAPGQQAQAGGVGSGTLLTWALNDAKLLLLNCTSFKVSCSVCPSSQAALMLPPTTCDRSPSVKAVSGVVRPAKLNCSTVVPASRPVPVLSYTSSRPSLKKSRPMAKSALRNSRSVSLTAVVLPPATAA